MSSTIYQPWAVTAGEVPTTAFWNILGSNDASFNTGQGFNDNIIVTRHLASGIAIAPVSSNPYKFSVYRNAAWTSSNNAYGIVNFDTKTFDTSSNVDIVTNKGRFTAPIAGFYYFTGGVAIATSSSGSVYESALYKNGSSAKQGVGYAAGSVFGVNTIVSGLLQLAINDFVEVYVFSHGEAGATGSNLVSFDGFLVSQT